MCWQDHLNTPRRPWVPGRPPGVGHTWPRPCGPPSGSPGRSGRGRCPPPRPWSRTSAPPAASPGWPRTCPRSGSCHSERPWGLPGCCREYHSRTLGEGSNANTRNCTDLCQANDIFYEFPKSKISHVIAVPKSVPHGVDVERLQIWKPHQSSLNDCPVYQLSVGVIETLMNPVGRKSKSVNLGYRVNRYHSLK